MQKLLGYLNGPNVYATLRPRAGYGSNFMERIGGVMLYASQVLSALAWPTSPFWMYYCYYRMDMSVSSLANVIYMLITYHSVAYGLRMVGRLNNPVYRTYIELYERSRESRTEREKLLETFDFEITSNAPVSFEAKPSDDLWYLDNTHELEGYSDLQIKQLRFVAMLCVHSFGRRMLYPGSLGLFRALLGEMVRQNRLRLILDQGGRRNQLKSIDGNIIDTMLFDRRNAFPDAPLVICCDGNAGFYETGIMRTPAELNFSVLGWNPPGFAESTGLPYPQQVLNAMNAVIQFAECKGFPHKQILLFGWSIGGFPSTWAAANYPDIGGLILDATFDDIMPLALTHMPAFASDVVKLAIREYFNLNVSKQLERYHGPVHIIRRTNDEVITTYQGPDEARQRDENRAKPLLLNFLQARYPDLVERQLDRDVILSYLARDEYQRGIMAREAIRVLRDKPYEEVVKEAHTRRHLINLLCRLHFADIPATHTTPLSASEFVQPYSFKVWPLNMFLDKTQRILKL